VPHDPDAGGQARARAALAARRRFVLDDADETLCSMCLRRPAVAGRGWCRDCLGDLTDDLHRRQAAELRRPPTMSAAVPRHGPWIFATVDDRRRVVLLRGDGARETVDALGLSDRYSRLARGHVVDLDRLPDVLAFTQMRRALCVVSDRKAPDR
jgi:hypothetical protein